MAVASSSSGTPISGRVFRQHLSVLWWPIASGGAMFLILVAGVVLMPYPFHYYFIALLPVPMLWVTVVVVDWASNWYVITPGWFIHYRQLPLFGRMSEDLLPLRRAAVTVQQTWLGRVLNFGDIEISLDGRVHVYHRIGRFREMLRLVEGSSRP